MGKKKKDKKKITDPPVKKKKHKSEKKSRSAGSADVENSVNAAMESSTLKRSVSKISKEPSIDTAEHRSLSADVRMLPIFQALSDENRLKIVQLLAIHERTTPELLELINVVQSTMSHHMKVLTEAGLVNCRKQGKRSCYSICPETVAQIREYFSLWIPSAADSE